MVRRLFDISLPAPNGLLRGYTTGTCATAAVKAALIRLLHGQTVQTVDISLPDPEWYIPIPLIQVQDLGDGTVRAEVLKYAGDDPDNTAGATIFAEVRCNHLGKLRFIAAEGVGTVTQPGLRIPPGEAAINPVPRLMMTEAVNEVLAGAANPGFDLAIGCVNGEKIALRTFNPRLGIIGGISILGTSGIVQPMSQAAWIASIEVYTRVALGDQPPAIAFTPGKIGLPYAYNVLELPKHRVVQIANFMGDSLEQLSAVLEENHTRLPLLWMLGHPGKIAKVLDDVWDTHSSKSNMAMGTIATVATNFGLPAPLVSAIEQANTVENVIQILQDHPQAHAFWLHMESLIAAKLASRLRGVDQLAVRLFSMDGTPLGAAR